MISHSERVVILLAASAPGVVGLGVGGGGGDSHTKLTGVIVGKFGKEPLKGTRILFLGRGLDNFLPQEVPNQLTDV